MAKKKMTVKQYLRSKKLSGEGVVAQIKAAYKHGYEKLELIAAGFNRNTVYRQTREVDIAL